MALDWLNRHKKSTEDDIEIKPEDIQKDLGIDTLRNDLNEMKTTNAAVMEFITQQKKDKEEAAARAAAEEAKKNQPPPVELDFYADPEGAVDAKLQPVVAQNIKLTSMMMRKDIFDDPAFEFYTGDVKQQVDAFIDSLPLAQRANPASIKNCYYVVMGQRMKDAQDGKLKSRFAGASTSGSGTGAPTGESQDVVRLSDEEKMIARQFGISEEKYAANKRETNYV